MTMRRRNSKPSSPNDCATAPTTCLGTATCKYAVVEGSNRQAARTHRCCSRHKCSEFRWIFYFASARLILRLADMHMPIHLSTPSWNWKLLAHPFCLHTLYCTFHLLNAQRNAGKICANTCPIPTPSSASASATGCTRSSAAGSCDC